MKSVIENTIKRKVRNGTSFDFDGGCIFDSSDVSVLIWKIYHTPFHFDSVLCSFILFFFLLLLFSCCCFVSLNSSLLAQQLPNSVASTLSLRAWSRLIYQICKGMIYLERHLYTFLFCFSTKQIYLIIVRQIFKCVHSQTICRISLYKLVLFLH